MKIITSKKKKFEEKMNSGKKRELYFNRKLWIESIFHERDIIHFLISLQHLFTHTHTHTHNIQIYDDSIDIYRIRM